MFNFKKESKKYVLDIYETGKSGFVIDRHLEYENAEDLKKQVDGAKIVLDGDNTKMLTVSDHEIFITNDETKLLNKVITSSKVVVEDYK